MKDTLDNDNIRLYIKNIDLLKREIKGTERQMIQHKEDMQNALKAQVITDEPRCHVEGAAERRLLDLVHKIKVCREGIDWHKDVLWAIEKVLGDIQPYKKRMVKLKYWEIPQGREVYTWAEVGDMIGLTEMGCKKADSKIVKDISNTWFDIRGRKVWDNIQKCIAV